MFVVAALGLCCLFCSFACVVGLSSLQVFFAMLCFSCVLCLVCVLSLFPCLVLLLVFVGWVCASSDLYFPVSVVFSVGAMGMRRWARCSPHSLYFDIVIEGRR